MIASSQKNFSLAQTNLSQAISNNFMIRENPLFMLIKGEVEYAQQNYPACLTTLEQAYEISEVKEKGSGSKSGTTMSIL